MRAVGGDGDLLLWWQIRLGILLLQSIFWEFCEIHKKTWTFVTSCYFCSLNSPLWRNPCNPCNHKFFTLTHPSWIPNPRSSRILQQRCPKRVQHGRFTLCKQQKRSMAPWSFMIQKSLLLNKIYSNILHLEALNTHFLHFLGTILLIKHQQSSWWHHLSL